MKRILVALICTLLAACENAPGTYTPAPLSFQSAPLRINVAEIRVMDNARTGAGDVGSQFPTPPKEALKQWANQRLIAVGTQGVLEVSIDDASVRETKLPKTEGVKGLFTDDQDARYDARMAVTLRLFNGQDVISVASGDVNVTRSKSINEKASINDRERMFDAMTRDMMQNVDTQANARLRQYFSAYLR